MLDSQAQVALFAPFAAPLLLPQDGGGVDVVQIVLLLVLFVISLGIHEAAHAWVADRCGDSTARDLGRLTLNPIPHIDLFHTILLPGFLYWVTQGRFLFGGAKPVPVLFHRLRNPWRDMSLVAIAGPLSNFLLAILFMGGFRLFLETGWYVNASPPGLRHDDLLPTILQHAVLFNLLLAVFNMVPIPPLDGSRVMAWLLPGGLRETYVRFEQFGIYAVFLLILFVPPFKRWLWETVSTLYYWVDGLYSLGGLR